MGMIGISIERGKMRDMAGTGVREEEDGDRIYSCNRYVQMDLADSYAEQAAIDEDRKPSPVAPPYAPMNLAGDIVFLTDVQR